MSHIRELTDDAIVPVENATSVVKPYVMSHGTLGCFDMAKSRKFYEEFLGLECIQHGPTSMVIRCGLKFHVVCVQSSEYAVCDMHNHWGIDVRSEDEVNAAHKAALEKKEQYGIQQVFDAEQRHGVYSFYLIDRDNNWWEIQYYPGFQNDDMFDFGDRFTPDGKPITRGAQ